VAHNPVTEGKPDLSRKANLIQRSGRWYFNRAYPKDLWPVLGKSPFRLSLHTDSLEVALRRRPDAERRYFAAADKARGHQEILTPRQLSEIDAVAIAVARRLRSPVVLPHLGMFPNGPSLPHLKCSLLGLGHDCHSLLTGCPVADP
jgi:hypothetical protein